MAARGRMPRSSRRSARLRAIAVSGWLVAMGLPAATGPDPFQSLYRLKVSEPLEGATVSGASVRVVAELELRTESGSPARDATPPPRPRLEIFLDNASKGSLKEGQNSLTIEGVTPGTHTILVTANDPSGGAIVERKEIHFTVLPPD